MALSYADLLAEANETAREKGLEFEAKDGSTVLLRPLEVLPSEDLKKVQKYIDIVGDDKVSLAGRIDAIDAILILVADRKDPLKKSLADLPTTARTRIFEEWQKDVEAGE